LVELPVVACPSGRQAAQTSMSRSIDLAGSAHGAADTILVGSPQGLVSAQRANQPIGPVRLTAACAHDAMSAGGASRAGSARWPGRATNPAAIPAVSLPPGLPPLAGHA